MSEKYPWIPKKYFAAVMFACKMIRENGYFNKAIDTAADYYNVDSDTLARHVRARQAAGQKGRAGVNAGKKLKWWFVPTYQNASHDSCWEVEPSVRCGYSKESVRNTLIREDDQPIWSEDFMSFGEAVGPFDTKDEAANAADAYMKGRGGDAE